MSKATTKGSGVSQVMRFIAAKTNALPGDTFHALNLAVTCPRCTAAFELFVAQSEYRTSPFKTTLLLAGDARDTLQANLRWLCNGDAAAHGSLEIVEIDKNKADTKAADHAPRSAERG